MIAPPRVRSPWLVLAAFVALTAAGCSKKAGMDVPQYPGSSQVSGMPNQESEIGTLYRVRHMTPDGVRTVAAYYRDELVTKRGWTETQGVGPTFVDGNLTVTWNGGGAGEAAPVDPTRAGGQVVVFETDDRTFVAIWQHLPK